MELVLEAGHSHLYPGSGGFLRGSGPAASGGVCRIDFADGSVAFGSLKPGGGEAWELAVDPYATRAGTRIPAKRWRIGLDRDAGDRTAFRVLGRLG